MSRFIFSGFITITLVALSVGGSKTLCLDLLEAIKNGDEIAEQLAREIGPKCIDHLYVFELNMQLRRKWNKKVRSYITAEIPHYVARPMHTIALIFNREDVAIILLEMGADVFVADKAGNTPLHIASSFGLNKAVNKIIDLMNHRTRDQASNQRGIDLTNCKGETPLHQAISFHWNKVAKTLLIAGANSMITDGDGNTALFYAANYGGTEEIIIDIIEAARPTPTLSASLDEQLNHDGLKDLIINCENNEGHTALFIAVKRERYGIARILFENGADPTITTTLESTVFHSNVAPSLTRGELLSMIQNTDVNQRYNDGSTLLHCAIKSLREKVAEDLLKRGADPTIPDHDGNTALHLALKHLLHRQTIIDIINVAMAKTVDIVGHNEMTDPSGELLHDGLDRDAIGPATPNGINLRNKLGQTPLFLAIQTQRYDIAKVLIDHGAYPDITDNTGNTPFQWRAMKSFWSSFKTLISTAWTSMKKLFSIWLFIVNGEEVVKYMLIKGADPRIRDINGNTALHQAVMHQLSPGVIVNLIHAGESRPVGQDEMNHGQLGGSLIPVDRSTNNTYIYSIQTAELISQESIINFQNYQGETALSLAISMKWVQGVEILLAMGAGRTINVNEQIALELAIEMNANTVSEDTAKIVELLQNLN